MACGVTITDTLISLAVMSDDGEFVFENSCETPKDYDAILGSLTQMVSSLPASVRTDSIGLSMAGFFNPQTSAVHLPTFPALHHKPLKHDMQARLGRAVTCISFGQALAASEMNKDKPSSVFALHLDKDVSGGMMLGRTLVTGLHGLSGNWGHISLPWPVDYETDGRVCSCGRTGCLAHFTSLSGLEHDYQLLTNQALPADRILSQALAGDIVAESAVQVLEDRIARGLALVINLIDPEHIILGGRLAALDRMAQNIPRKWPGYCDVRPITTTLTVLHDYQAAVLSGACLAGRHP